MQGRDAGGVPAETELLLSCARTATTPDVTARVEALCRRGVEWPRVVEMAAWHRVTPLLYLRLKQTCPRAVPGSVLESLGERFHRNAAKNVKAAARVQTLLEHLEAEGVRAISFKGPTLAVLGYGSLALRVFDDVDLLVAREDVTRASAVLVSQGYRPELALTERQHAALVEAERPCAFVDEENRLTIDLHWAITPRHLSPPVDSAWLHDHTETVAIRGREVRTLSREALLLVLCVHGAKHLWERLIWVCDVAALLGAGEGIPWSALEAQAREWKSERILGLGLTLAGDLLQASLPDDVRRRLAGDRAVRWLAARARARLLRHAGAPLGAVESARFHLAAMDRWRDRLRYLQFVTTPSEADWRTVALPTGLGFLYYPLRVARLLSRGPEKVHLARRAHPR